MGSSGLPNDFNPLLMNGGDASSSANQSLGTFPGLIHSFSEAAILASADGEIVDLNEAASHLLGYEARDLISNNLRFIIPGWSQHLVRGDNDRGAIRLPAKARHADSREISIRGQVIRNDEWIICLLQPAPESFVKPITPRGMPVVHFHIVFQHDRLLWDETAATYFGFPSGVREPSWTTFRSMIESEDADWFEESLTELQHGSEEVEFEFAFRRPDGRKIWIRLWAHVEAGDDFNVVCASAMDTTLIWEAKSALHETSQHYRAALQASLDCFFLLQAKRTASGEIEDYIFIDLNRQSEQMLSMSADELIGKQLSHVLRMDMHVELFPKYRRVTESRLPIQEEFCIPIAYSSPVWMHHQVVPVGDGVAIKCRDITTRRQVEQDLQLTQFAVENAAETMLIISDKGSIISINDSGRDRLGFNQDDIELLSIWDIDSHIAKEDWDTWFNRLRQEQRLTIETEFIRTDGTLIPVEAASALFEFETQIYICIFARDTSAWLAEAAKVADLNRRLEAAYDATLLGWSKALDMRDNETEFHSNRVTEATVALAKRMGVSDEEIVHIRRGALLHDIGKMGIPDQILHKPGQLTEEEWAIMRQHPTFAYEMLKPIEYLADSLSIPYSHHERWDGTGYPLGLKGEEIPLAARIFAIVDVFDALRSERPYRPAWPIDKVIDHLHTQVGTHFDPEVAKAFFSWLAEREATLAVTEPALDSESVELV